MGTACVGMSHALLKNLKEKYGIIGSLAVARQHAHPFVHAAVLIECRDGFILLDPSDDDEKVLSFPFERTNEYPIFGLEQLFITTFKPGSFIPMTWKMPGQLDKECCEFCLNINNGDDVVMKNYIMDSSKPDGKIAIVVRNAKGSPRKYILVFLKESKLVFKDKNTTKEYRTKEISFQSIRKGKMLPILKAFMKPNYCCLVPGFHIPIGTLYQQIVTLVLEEKRIQKLFTQANLDEPFLLK